MSNGQHVLVLGGARSGKSKFAEELALELADCPAYIATAKIHDHDEEMAQRIILHQQRRKDLFTNIEEPCELIETIRQAKQAHDVILVDCLTLWVSNLMLAKRDIANECKKLCLLLQELDRSRIIFVSSEVGLGIVPGNKLAREFRDYVGLLHQDLAPICTNVIFISAGLPLSLKGDLSNI